MSDPFALIIDVLDAQLFGFASYCLEQFNIFNGFRRIVVVAVNDTIFRFGYFVYAYFQQFFL